MTIRAFTLDAEDAPHMRYVLESLEHIVQCDACKAEASTERGRIDLVEPICEWLNDRVMPPVHTFDECIAVMRTWLSLYDSAIGQLLSKRSLDS